MRLLLTIAIIKKFTVFTTDVPTAFLNTPINEEVLVEPPKEYCFANVFFLSIVLSHCQVHLRKRDIVPDLPVPL
eukprot:1450077-Amphidinium_carterae.1